MNILCINHEYPPVGGGGATACKAIAREYARLGHGVTVVTCAFGQLPQEETIDGVRIIRVPCKRKQKDHSSFAEMLSFLASAYVRCDALVKHTPFGATQVFFGIPSGPVGLHLKKKYGLPYIVRLGGGDIPGTQARFAFVYKLIGPYLKRVWKEADAVVANSDGLLQRAMAFDANANLCVIPNGVDPADFPELPAREPGGTFRIVSTARIIRRKGLTRVVEALGILKDAGESAVRYTIIGDGPDRGALVERARALDVLERVEITGMLDRKDVLCRLPDFDAFVLPSDWEGMPNTVLEAMACGLPIIMTDCEGSAELVTDNGYIVARAGNIAKGIADAVLSLIQNEEMRKRMGQSGRSRALTAFTWEQTARKYIKLLSMQEE